MLRMAGLFVSLAAKIRELPRIQFARSNHPKSVTSPPEIRELGVQLTCTFAVYRV